MERLVRIDELARPCLTRPKGHEAFEKLLPMLKDGPVEIALDMTEAISASCLDGLVDRLIEEHLIDQVTFVVADPKVARKLGKVAWQHKDSVIFFRSSLGAERLPVPPVVSDAERPEHEISKGYTSSNGPLGEMPMHAKGRR
ncbi:MAG: hypothetical protein ACHQ9S_14170 [Candidatus Binatia bacterium]